MRMRTPAALALAVFTLGGWSAAAHAGTLTDHSFTHDGITRTYKKYIPSGLGTGARPLVIVLHGGNGTANQASASDHPFYEWRVLADSDKFIVVYPNGVNQGSGQQWHDCRSDWTGDGTADDVGFTSALIDQVDASHDVDLGRVYASGASNGGMMSLRLARELSDEIAAVGAIIANDPVDPGGECGNPSHPISVMIMNGDEDPLMPWGGGCVSGACNGTVESTFDTRDYYIGQIGASSTATSTHNYPNVNTRDNSSTVTRYRHTGGSQGTEVVLFRVWNGGHSTPSVAHKLSFFAQLALGNQNWDIEGVHELWAFMKGHTLGS